MKKSVIHHTVLLLCALLLVQLLPVNAQDGNLLQNPGFEAPFNTLDGDPPRQVAQGWTPWHVPAVVGSPTFVNRQPEYGSGSGRTLEGSDAQLITSFFATHDGGVYQRVTGITPGDTLRFSVFAYVWSSTSDNEDTSAENGDVHVQVGIDPTGGTDPGGEAIVWSPEAVEEYDAYNEYVVEAQAEADAVTVFVRTTIGVPVKNNNIYLDQAVLTASGTGNVEATDEATEPAALVTEVSTQEASVEPSTEAVVTEETAETIATEEAPEIVETEAVTEEPTTETVEPTEDSLALTATAIIADATSTAILPTATATEDTMLLTATAIIADATSTAAAALTATANVPAATATEDPLFMTATAFIAEATATAAANMTLTANVPAATATDDPLFLTATAIIADATSTAAAALPAATATTEPTATATEPPISELFPATISHTVARGDTVAILAERYSSTIDAIAQANGLDSSYFLQVGQVLVIPVREDFELEPTATTVVVTATPAGPVPALGTGNVYIVRPGDTLGRIARLFNTNVQTLAQLNGIVNINQIQVGQQLTLPAEQQPTLSPAATSTTTTTAPTSSSRPQATYTVRPGDSLYKISLMFGVSISEIAQANNLGNRNRIYVGQTLIIP